MYIKEIRELAALYFGSGYMSANEFAVLLDEYESCNPEVSMAKFRTSVAACLS